MTWSPERHWLNGKDNQRGGGRVGRVKEIAADAPALPTAGAVQTVKMLCLSCRSFAGRTRLFELKGISGGLNLA